MSVSGYLLQNPTTYYQIQIAGQTGAGRASVDRRRDADQGSTPPAHYVPAAPLEVGLIGEAPANVYYSDQPVRMQLRAANETSASRQRHRPLPGLRLAEPPRRAGRPLGCRCPADTTAVSDLDLSAVGRTGSFRVVAVGGRRVEQPERVRLRRRAQAAAPGDDPSSSIGIHSNFQPFQYAALSRLGIHWDRALSPGALFRWSLVEPKPGQFVWNDDQGGQRSPGRILDPRHARRAGAGVGARAAGVPISTRGRSTSARWSATTAARCRRGRSGTSPTIGFPPDFYAQMLARAAKAIRAADPSAQVVGHRRRRHPGLRPRGDGRFASRSSGLAQRHRRSQHPHVSLAADRASACDVEAKQFAALEQRLRPADLEHRDGRVGQRVSPDRRRAYAPSGTSLDPGQRQRAVRRRLDHLGRRGGAKLPAVDRQRDEQVVLLRLSARGLARLSELRIRRSGSTTTPSAPRGSRWPCWPTSSITRKGLGPLSLTASGAQGVHVRPRRHTAGGPVHLRQLPEVDHAARDWARASWRPTTRWATRVPVSGSTDHLRPASRCIVEGHGISVDQMRVRV